MGIEPSGGGMIYLGPSCCWAGRSAAWGWAVRGRRPLFFERRGDGVVRAGAAPHGDACVWKFHAWNALANGLGLWSVADSFLSQPIHWRTLTTEAINLIANAFVSLLYVFILHPDLGHVEIGWLGYALWAIYLPFMYCGSWMLPHSGIGPHSLSTLVVNVEYVSERFGLLVIITCGESLFAAVAILQQSDSVKKMLVACLSVYYALLIKLLYFELQSCVAKHAINVNALRSIMWTLAHLPLYISAAGAGAVLHWAATGHKWLVRERNLFLGFTCVLLLSLSIIALFHGKLHNDRGVWWTKKKARVSIRLMLCIIIVLGCVWPKKDRENVWTILYVCALVTIDFMYEFYAKRALFVEHQIEDREHLTEEEMELRKLLETLTGSQLNVTVPVGLKQGDSFNVKTSSGKSETITVPHGFVAGASPRLAASNRLREVRKKLKNIGSSVEDARARAEKRERITAAKAKLAAARRKITLARRIRPPTERVRSPTI
jgi:hypothetical protein